MSLTLERHRELIRRAVAIVGSQGKLGKKLGITQQGVYYLLYKAERVTGEMALAIEDATNGKVTRKMLRPDLFRKRPKTAGKSRTAHPAAAGEGKPIVPPAPSPV
jgi:DNA-binding transcriptional regulator YdaS (Cro superfamily)